MGTGGDLCGSAGPSADSDPGGAHPAHAGRHSALGTLGIISGGSCGDAGDNRRYSAAGPGIGPAGRGAPYRG